MALPAEIAQDVADALERAYGAGQLDGRTNAQAEYIGKSARVLTGGLFAASLDAAGQMLRPHDAEAADFFHEKAAEFKAWVTPAKIESVEPADGATGIALSNGITAKFVQPGLRKESVTDANVFVTVASGGSHLAGDLAYDDKTGILTFAPANPLSAGTAYKLTLGAGLQAAGGLLLGDDHTVTFTTAAG